MVPGMTERERRAAEVRRLEWLADTRVGPFSIARARRESGSAVASLAIWRRGLAAALLLGQRVRVLASAGTPLSERTLAPLR